MEWVSEKPLHPMVGEWFLVFRKRCVVLLSVKHFPSSVHIISEIFPSQMVWHVGVGHKFEKPHSEPTNRAF
jgi:hypothetical protein